MRDQRATRLVILSLALAAAATLAVVLLGRRRRPAGTAPSPGTVTPEAAPDWLRSFVTARFNPAVERLGLVGGRRSPWAYLEHIGRQSARVYRTPVLPQVVGDHAYVPLPYGTEVHWARNVRHAGHCRLQRQGLVYELDEPAIVTPAQHPGVPERLRPMLERRGRRYLRLHVLRAMPGALDDAPVLAEHPEPAPVAG